MLKRVFDDNDYPTYYCTLCNRPFKALQEANEHGRFCGKAVPTQPVFRSYTMMRAAATFELKDDATQFYTNEARTWQGLTDEEIWSVVSRIGTADSDVNPYITLKDARAIEAALKKKNT